jgi:regulator of nonsense transcripts 3
MHNTNKKQENISREIYSEENSVKKIVIRRLPPNLTQEQFLVVVAPLPEYDYFYYVNGDDRFNFLKNFLKNFFFIKVVFNFKSLDQYSYCRAYLCFKNSKDIFPFKDRFDNYVFLDSKSNEYSAIVEYAPYQRRLIRHNQHEHKKDSRLNTIDQDLDYIKFTETYNRSVNEYLPSCEDILLELEQRHKEKTSSNSNSLNDYNTPLLDFLRKKKDVNTKFNQ